MTLLAAAALVMLVIGHVLRAIRQATLFPVGQRPRTFHLAVGLSVAYVVDAFAPFRIGEAARAIYVSARNNQSFSLVCATVIAERLSDLACVVLILLGLPLLLGGHSAPPASIATMAGALIVAIAVAYGLRKSIRARRTVWTLASFFNDRLRLTIADTAWTTVRLLAAGTLLRPRYLLLSLVMWAAYLQAFALLGQAVGAAPSSVIISLIGRPLSPLLGLTAFAVALMLVTALAALLLLVTGLLVDGSGIERSIRRVIHLGLPQMEMSPAATGASFARDEDYGAILRAHFTERASAMASFGLHGLDGAVVQRLLPGGSDAITAVVEDDDRLAIRKFAFGLAGDKLAEQAGWLQAYREDLPLADVISQSRGEARFHFDMPYLSSARDLYEMVHIMPPAASRALLIDVIDRVADWHRRHAGGACSQAALDVYVDRKVVANARRVLDFARLQLPERYLINGEAFTLEEWKLLLDPAWIAAQMPTRAVSAIHGDLTIENIIVCPERTPGWYLIDPNPGNLFDTPMIDWAKLMQSLNLGYEALNRAPPGAMRDDAIDVMFARSRIYADLHDTLRGQLRDRFGAEWLREVSFHEIVNYLRLVPYKIRNNPAKAMTFFAAASVLLRRYVDGRDD